MTHIVEIDRTSHVLAPSTRITWYSTRWRLIICSFPECNRLVRFARWQRVHILVSATADKSKQQKHSNTILAMAVHGCHTGTSVTMHNVCKCRAIFHAQFFLHESARIMLNFKDICSRHFCKIHQ